MRYKTVFLFILLVMLVTACQGKVPEATVATEPSVAPTDLPTEEIAVEPTEADPTAELAPDIEPTEAAAEVGDTTSGSMDDQIALMAAIA